MNQLSQEILYAIGLIAEAKAHFLVAAQGTKPNTEARTREMKALETCTKRARDYVDQTCGGIGKLPKPLAIDLLVCEKGLAKLGGPAPKPHKTEIPS